MAARCRFSLSLSSPTLFIEEVRRYATASSRRLPAISRQFIFHRLGGDCEQRWEPTRERKISVGPGRAPESLPLTPGSAAPPGGDLAGAGSRMSRTAGLELHPL